MISNPDRTKLISSRGRADHDGLWIFDVPAGREHRLPLENGARYLTLHSSGSNLFSVGHHFDGTRYEVTVHNFSDPQQIQARAAISQEENKVTGDALAWGAVPLLYVEYLRFEPWNDFVLLRVLPQSGRIQVQRLGWYDDTYNKLYQGVVGVLEVPGEQFAVVSVQRSSRVIFHDLNTGAKAGELNLGGGSAGNPLLQFHKGGTEIWATDYDRLVVIQRSNRQIHRSARLQGAAHPQMRHFIGDFSFAPDDEICAVARPFSGDVVGIDTATLAIKSTARVGHQPLEVAAVGRGEIVARDWKTGTLLRGQLA